MNITIICDVLGKENNGTTVAAMNLIRHLKSKGHNVKVVCNDQDKKNMEGYYIVPELNLLFLNKIVHKNGVKLSKLDKKTINKAIEGADLVHLLLPFRMSHYAAKYCKRKHIKISASFHCQAENVTSHLFLKNNNFINRQIYKFFYKRVYRYADVIHYPTAFIKGLFESVVGATNGVVISNGVNSIYTNKRIEKPDYLKDKFIILNIGRYCSEKNQSVLIKAINASKYKNKIHLILAGTGPDKEKLEALVKKYKIDCEFNFYSREELTKVINYSSLYVHPAEIEIESISCIEAISCGLVPIVSNSKRSATKNFAIDDKSLFNNNDFIDLANKIDYWIENNDEKEEYSKKYLQTSSMYDLKECMNSMEKMMIDTINEVK